MPYLYCYIDYGCDFISQNIFISQKKYNNIVALEKKYNKAEYDYASGSFLEAISDKYPQFYDELCDIAVQYVALFLADGTYKKTWEYYFDIKIDSIFFDSDYRNDIEIDERKMTLLLENYLKIIQWKCSDSFVEQLLSYIDIKDENNRTEVKKIVEKHNKRYKLSYKEWEKKGGYQLYAYEQYKREFEQLLEDISSSEEILQIGKELQEDYKQQCKIGEKILTQRNLEDLVLLLNRHIKERFPSSSLVNFDMSIQKIFHDANQIPVKYDGSIRTRCVPMGGQGGYKRRIKRK